MEPISMAIASLGAAKDMAKGFLALKGEIEQQQLVIDLQSKILDAQSSALEALAAHQERAKEIDRLKAEIARAADQRATIAKMTRNTQGLYLADGDAQPYCPRCIEVDLKLVHLTTISYQALRGNLKCWACKSTY